MSTTFVDIRGVSRAFGGLQALSDVSFSVPRGAIKAVIGPNGAGKTTLFNVISGQLSPHAGSVFLEGREITGYPPHRIAGLGIARTFQSTRLFPGMSVIENVMTGMHLHTRTEFGAALLGRKRVRNEERECRRRARELLKAFSLEDCRDLEGVSLPYGQQRLVELTRAVALEPKALLLDEPAAGLNIPETRRLAETIRAIRERGITVLLVEHDMSLVMEISEEVVVLHNGRWIAEGPPSLVQRDSEVIRVYLGEDHA